MTVTGQLETINESIYDHPKYYDLVFGSDCAAEVKFILGCGAKFLKREPSRLFDPEYGPGEAPHEIGRQRFGRIAIANSDAGASAYLDAAIDQAWRAVGELSG